MKYILFIFLLTSCTFQPKEPKSLMPFKYNIYDVVYILPDSTKVVITDTARQPFSNQLRYRVGKSSPTNGIVYFNIPENLIISK